jgi:hypothetical protein
MPKETPEQAGYEVDTLNEGDFTAIFRNKETGKRELWFQNDGHASYGITVNGHDYEFVSSSIRQTKATEKDLYHVAEEQPGKCYACYSRRKRSGRGNLFRIFSGGSTRFDRQQAIAVALDTLDKAPEGTVEVSVQAADNPHDFPNRYEA